MAEKYSESSDPSSSNDATNLESSQEMQKARRFREEQPGFAMESQIIKGSFFTSDDKVIQRIPNYFLAFVSGFELPDVDCAFGGFGGLIKVTESRR